MASDRLAGGAGMGNGNDMAIEFNRPIIAKGNPPQLERVVWRSLPDRLKALYRPNKPLYTLTAPVLVYWRGWRLEALPGMVTDLASIPWIVHPIGFTRNNRSNWMDVGAILHDGLYYGAAKLDDNLRRNRRLADALMVDLWREVGGKRLKPWLQHKAVRAFGWFPYKPDYSLNDGTLMTVEPIAQLDEGRADAEA